MSTNKKRFLVGLFVFVLTLIVALGGWWIAVRPRPEQERPAPDTVEWTPIQKMDEYKTLYDSAIVEMRLRQTTDYPEEVVFSDSDLLEKWETYLTGLEVKWDSYAETELDGGVPFVQIETKTGDFKLRRFSLDQGDGIQIGDSYYLLNKPIDSLFDETYEQAEERHGTVSLLEE